MKFCMATKYYKSTSYILASITVHGICIWDINSELGPGSESGIYLKSSIWQNLLSQSVFRCVYKHRERGRERESHLEISFTFYGFLVAITCESD